MDLQIRKDIQGDFNMTYFDERLKEVHGQKLQKKRLEAMQAELMQQEDEVAKKAAELAAKAKQVKEA